MSENETGQTRGDERIDLIVADTNSDGKADLWVVDTDGDGKADLFQFDHDGDGQVDLDHRPDPGQQRRGHQGRRRDAPN